MSLKVLLFQRHILAPWLAAAATMFGMSYVWHGIALTDLEELRIPLTLYFVLAGLVYLGLGLLLTFAVHEAIRREVISLKQAFPFASFLLGAVVGFCVYLVIFVLGMTFTKHGMMHFLVDILWQMMEQALGGLAVSLGIIYDMHRRFMEQERA